MQLFQKFFCILLFLIPSISFGAPQQYIHQNILSDAPHIGGFQATTTGQVTVETIITARNGSRADTILYILEQGPVPSGGFFPSFHPVAMNDDCTDALQNTCPTQGIDSTFRSKVSFNAIQGKTYLAFVIPYQTDNSGWIDVVYSGAISQTESNYSFAGSVTTVNDGTEPNATYTYHALRTSGNHVVSTSLTLTSEFVPILIGLGCTDLSIKAHSYLNAHPDAVGPHNEAISGKDICRVYMGSDSIFSIYRDLIINDREPSSVTVDPRDDDNDGLGLELEKALGICDRRSQGGICSIYAVGTHAVQSVFNLKDTDNDGIPDGIEVLGDQGVAPGGTKYKPTAGTYLYEEYPFMGAHPRIKDIFYEFDFVSTQSSMPSLPVLFNVDFVKKVSTDYFGSNVPQHHIHAHSSNETLRLHFDLVGAGIDRSGKGLYGEWGGSDKRSHLATGPPYSSLKHLEEDYRRNNIKSSLRDKFFRSAVIIDTSGGRCGGLGIAGNAYFGSTQYYPGGKFMYISYDDANFFLNLGLSIDKKSCAKNFAHEMGHNLGLGHGGAKQNLGEINSKANYPSIMSYVYTPYFSPNVGFYKDPPQWDSTLPATSIPLNPSFVFEAQGLGENVNAVPNLDGKPWYLDVTNPSFAPFMLLVDWNRNGQIDNPNNVFTKGMRYPVTLSNGRATEVGGMLKQTLDSSSTGSLKTPKTIVMEVEFASNQVEPRIFSFYTKQNAQGIEQIYYRTAVFIKAPNSSSSCTGGDKTQWVDKSVSPWQGHGDDQCLQWQGSDSGTLLGTGIAAKSVTAIAVESNVANLKNRIVIAYVNSSDNLKITWTSDLSTSQPSDPLQMASTTLSVPLYYKSLHEPELVFSKISNNQPSEIGLFFVSSQTKWVTKVAIDYNAGIWSIGAINSIINDHGQAIIARTAPTIIRFPDFSNDSQMCGIFPGDVPDGSDFPLFLYCYNKNSGEWDDLTDRLYGNPTSNAKVGFVYRHQRKTDGTLLNTTTKEGQFWLLTTVTSDGSIILYPPGTNMVKLYLSKKIDNTMLYTDSEFRFLDFKSEYHNQMSPRTTSGISLVNDVRLATIHGLSFYGSSSSTSAALIQLPFADGTFNGNLVADSDFKVMSRMICRSIQSDAFCGKMSDNLWGY